MECWTQHDKPFRFNTHTNTNAIHTYTVCHSCHITISGFPLPKNFAYCIFDSITNEVHINAANNATTKRNWLRVVRYFNNKRHFSFPLTRRHTVSYFNFYYYCHLQFNTSFVAVALFCFVLHRFLFVSFWFVMFPLDPFFTPYLSCLLLSVHFFSFSHSTVGSSFSWYGYCVCLSLFSSHSHEIVFSLYSK